MCGIAGVYNFKGDKKIEKPLIERMCSVLVHRGPDDEGIYCKDNIGLGHRRLSIIDIEGGHQPMSNEDGSLWITYSGEIYNFLQLKDMLIKKGHVFKTRSDTEVILHLYEEKKEKCLDELNGPFAFAIWDDKNQTLFVARDRLGIKPLHYSVIGGKFIFASEIKAILQDTSVKREVDYEALHDYLTLMYVPAPKTMFKDIKKLPAGHYLLCNKDKFAIKQYWDIDFSETTSETEDQISDNIYARLKESVRLRLISDVTLGAFLSGGIDSSSIVSLMSQLQDSPVITNSIGFSDKSYDELKYARLISERYSTEHHEYIVEPSALDILDKLIWFYDEPFGDSSSIPTYYVSKMARKNVKVALSGDGGDENFAGYTGYMYCNAMAKVQVRTPDFLKNAARSVSSRMTNSYENIWAMKIKNKLDELFIPLFDLHFKNISIFREDERAYLYSHALTEKIKGYSTKDNFRTIFKNCKSPDYLSKLQYLDIKTSLCDEMLTKAERAGMANSLEVRTPILDHTFMQYVATVPSQLKAKGLSGKYIFKKAMSRNLPSSILNRPKMGFEIPLERWLKCDLKSLVEAELFDKSSIISELFNPQYIKKLWLFLLHSQIKGFKKKDLACKIWLLFLFSRWFKKYMTD